MATPASTNLLSEFRSFDGSGNSLTDPTMNVAGGVERRLGTAHFNPDGSILSGPNARLISNTVSDGGDFNLAETPNALGLSGMTYVWGQFIDHDLDRTPSDGVNHIDVPIAANDPDHPGATISMTRFQTSGGAAVNAISGWIDGSQVYGSDAATAASLRTADGHLVTSAGNNLPIVGGSFVSGDVRAAENPDLSAITALFVREHNRQVDLLAKTHKDWTGDQLYQQTRAIVGAEIAHITYDEFLPHVLGQGGLPAYAGYNPAVNARVAEEFATVAFRFGHSIVSDEETKVDTHGNEVFSQSLADAFFATPADVEANGGIDALLRHLPSDDAPENDVYAVESLRNALPGQFDLIAVDIQRLRDRGIGSLNETRAALGLPQYTSFDQITSDPTVASHLAIAYGTVSAVDLFEGGLAENHVGGGMLGETFRTIVANQFAATRDGDRLWYQNAGFDQATLMSIKTTTLGDLVRLNSDSLAMPKDTFIATEHGGNGPSPHASAHSGATFVDAVAARHGIMLDS